MRIPVPYHIGFSDGEVRSYQKRCDGFDVIVNTWNDVLLKINFSDVVGVSDSGVGDISGFVEEDTNSPFMDQVLNRLYEVMPASYSYHLYQFLDLDDQPALEIIAGGVSISTHLENEIAELGQHD